jgi:NAD(P)-dependent dehydrogenase (short-subunit alcohol dehydrogenase family)
MSERVAIVVGAGGYLGRATAARLAIDGFTVVGIDRNEDQLKKLPAGIRYEAGDPTDPAAAGDLIKRIGRVDVLVNTIGTFHPGGLMEATPEGPRRTSAP